MVSYSKMFKIDVVFSFFLGLTFPFLIFIETNVWLDYEYMFWYF